MVQRRPDDAQEILNYAEEYRAQHDGAAPEHHLQFARNCSRALLPSVNKLEDDGLEVIATYAMTESMPASNPRLGERPTTERRVLGRPGDCGGKDQRGT